ncbi:MAG: winged helix-turn-helix transcriptional regulator [Candidatus Thorarchaeota archaeon]
MDLINKRILILLDNNCRMSYRTIADMMGMTANAVKKRIEAMVENGTIVKFNLMPTQAMSGLSFFFGIIETHGNEDTEKFMNQVGSTSIVAHVSQLAYGEGGGYAIYGQYQHAKSLADSLGEIRRMDCVQDIEFHNALTFEGTKISLTGPQKKLLRAIVDDPRMTISDIADETNLSARRVRRELDFLIESRAFHFGLRWNLATEKRSQILVYTQYSKEFNVQEFVEWVYDRFELEAWAVTPSAMEPILATPFVTDSLGKIPEIIRELREYNGIENIRHYVVYTTRKFPWPAERMMNELIA